MMDKPLDLLGRELAVGDHVVWQMGHGLGHGFVTNIKVVDTVKNNARKQVLEPHTYCLVTATKAEGSRKRGQTARPEEFCAIVLPNIQHPEEQLGA